MLLRKKKNSFLTGFALLTIFYLLTASGILNEFNDLLNQTIVKRGLPRYYFPIYFSFGLLMPLILRFCKSSRTDLKVFIDPYLILLFFQIITEVILVLQVGKGIGVIVGLVFSILRLFQLKQLLLLKKDFKIINIFLYFQLVIWTFNVVQIVFNRMVPLINLT